MYFFIAENDTFRVNVHLEIKSKRRNGRISLHGIV